MVIAVKQAIQHSGESDEENICVALACVLIIEQDNKNTGRD